MTYDMAKDYMKSEIERERERRRALREASALKGNRRARISNGDDVPSLTSHQQAHAMSVCAVVSQ